MRLLGTLVVLLLSVFAGCLAGSPDVGPQAPVRSLPTGSLVNSTLDMGNVSAVVAKEPVEGEPFEVVVNSVGVSQWRFQGANWSLEGTTPGPGVYAFTAPAINVGRHVNATWSAQGVTKANGTLQFDVWGTKLTFPAEPTASHVIRPGIYSQVCTTNFIFHYKWYRLFIGTAAHCADGARGTGDCAGSQMKYGQKENLEGGIKVTHAWSSWNTMNEVGVCHDGNDFALFEIARADWGKVHPKGHGIIGHVTGLGDCRKLEPNVAYGGTSTDLELEAYGRSNLRSPGVRSEPDDPRNDKVGEFLTVDSEDFQCHMYYDSPGIPGDSGGPLAQVDGKALGAASTVSVVPPASNHYTNIATALEFLEEHEGWRPEVVASK